jgi:hypothetical protein
LTGRDPEAQREDDDSTHAVRYVDTQSPCTHLV